MDRRQHTVIGSKILQLLKGVRANLLEGTSDHGLRRASIRGFHAFRVTWVTLALNNNVPLDIIGHRTIEIVLKRYYQPNREDFRNALKSKMPEILMR